MKPVVLAVLAALAAGCTSVGSTYIETNKYSRGISDPGFRMRTPDGAFTLYSKPEVPNQAYVEMLAREYDYTSSRGESFYFQVYDNFLRQQRCTLENIRFLDLRSGAAIIDYQCDDGSEDLRGRLEWQAARQKEEAESKKTK